LRPARGAWLATACLLLLLVAHAAPVLAGEIYMVTKGDDKLLVFDADAQAPTAPVRNASIAAYANSWGVAVRDQEVFVTNDDQDSITVFNATATGTPTFKRRIQGAATGLDLPRELVIDGTDLYVISENTKNILVFNVLDDGNVAPRRTITLHNATGEVEPYVRGLDIHGADLFVATGYTGLHYSVSKLPKSSNGTVTPDRFFPLPATGNTPRAIVVEGDEIYVGNMGPDLIWVYPIGSSGSATPSRTISGANTGLNQPYGLAVRDGLIYTSQYGANTLLVFNASADGNVFPLRTLANNAMGISTPTTIAFAEDSAVTLASVQPPGVVVAMNGTSAIPAVQSPAVAASGLAARTVLRSDAMAFNASVSPAGSAAVFRFVTTNLEGSAGGYALHKVFDDGSSRAFTYSANATYAEGAWWLTDADGTWLAESAPVVMGTTYYANMVVQDNGKYDGNPIAGQITDPFVLTGGGSGGAGCVLRRGPSDAWSAAEWLALAALGFVAVLLRRRLRG
jgi:hypothetical protein